MGGTEMVRGTRMAREMAEQPARAHELATVLGHDPDSPPGLSKVTAT